MITKETSVVPHYIITLPPFTSLNGNTRAVRGRYTTALTNHVKAKLKVELSKSLGANAEPTLDLRALPVDGLGMLDRYSDMNTLVIKMVEGDARNIDSIVLHVHSWFSNQPLVRVACLNSAATNPRIKHTLSNGIQFSKQAILNSKFKYYPYVFPVMRVVFIP